LIECHQIYLNIKGIDRLDYVTYLMVFDKLFEIPKDRKTSSDYKHYLEALFTYLYDFTKRIKPMLDINEELSESIVSGLFSIFIYFCTNSCFVHSREIFKINFQLEIFLVGPKRPVVLSLMQAPISIYQLFQVQKNWLPLASIV